MNLTGEERIKKWLREKKWKMANFQKETLDAFIEGKSGILNAPTGSGKTYALWFPIMVKYFDEWQKLPKAEQKGLQVIWITPLRALAKDIQRNLQDACDQIGMPWKIGIRTGDTAQKEKASQKKLMPEALIITPESLHLLFTQKETQKIFANLKVIVADEWHELLGSKRGTQTELALSRLKKLQIQIWGISATIGNLEQASDVLLGLNYPVSNKIIIRANEEKKISIVSILPDKVETLPWAGHLGINLIDKVVAVVKNYKTTLLFTNTRSQTEIWYRTILEKYPDFAGIMALHHGSIDREMRNWVEEALHTGKLQLVICTSSLDLGVDFRPVECVIQVGSPKSVSRFIQRAGRSGHQPGQPSIIYFTPTHSLELIEAVALREGVIHKLIESRVPVMNAFDVLAQWLVTLATGDGFKEAELFDEIKNVYSFQFLERTEWEWILGYITRGSASLLAYDEFKKVEIEDGIFKVKERKIAMRHRLSMGTIVSDASLRVKFQHGKYLGSIEESFISRLKPEDIFWFSGISVEFLRIREMTVTVRKSENKKGIVPQWLGGRMPLSSQLSAYIREILSDVKENKRNEPEILKIEPLLKVQQERSSIPSESEFLIEMIKSREGYHIFFFPFEGRLVHEGMAALLAYRISLFHKISFSIAMNDYGFELLSDTFIDIKELLEENDLFTTLGLLDDIQKSMNSTEMAKRKFREIASISGMVFNGFPGKQVKTKHLQASSALLYEVLRDYEKNNLFIRQAYQEVLDFQLEEQRLRRALERISSQNFIFQNPEKPSPFAFPILVDRLREQLTSEKLEDRVKKMIRQYGGDS